MTSKIHPTTISADWQSIHDLASDTSSRAYHQLITSWAHTLEVDAIKDEARSRHHLARLARETAHALSACLDGEARLTESGSILSPEELSRSIARLRFDVMLEVAHICGLPVSVTRPLTEMLARSIPHMRHETARVPLAVDMAGWLDIS